MTFRKFILLTAMSGLTLAGCAHSMTSTSDYRDRGMSTQQKEALVASDPDIAVVQKMITAWNVRDWNLVADLFTEDGNLHSMMIDPVIGRETIRKRIVGLGAGIEDITLHIVNMGRVGDVIMIERVDEFTYNGNYGKVPVVGILEIEDGLVKEWREYYDRAELLHALGLEEDFG